MIETETLIRWTYELVAFANGEAGASPLFTAEDFDAVDFEAHRLPDRPRTPEQMESLRKLARRALATLKDWQPSKTEVPPRAVRVAAAWLDHPLVQDMHDAYSYTPMDGRLSLDENGRLQAEPRFRSPDAQYAVTFAELVRADAPAFIKQCWCGKFSIRLARARGRPRKFLLCREHHAQSLRTKKRTDK